MDVGNAVDENSYCTYVNRIFFLSDINGMDITSAEMRFLPLDYPESAETTLSGGISV